jgi:hypothetical protein
VRLVNTQQTSTMTGAPSGGQAAAEGVQGGFRHGVCTQEAVAAG